MKPQTKERAELVYSMLGQIIEKQSGTEQEFNRLTEICQLLKEDIEIGEKTSGVLDDLSELGGKALDFNSDEQREAFIKQEGRKLEEYHEHFKALFEEK
ncbi:hypothetical protein [Fictibacillus phosphorivorans]|uniref:hypothetical protein n=1 Tax=Fictibacillus phosphorivorans TaxID=1221500 RepID=UPI00203FF186|nr:hypothetical protein [Fictibacillus phosphorivorans]MCM3719419.1 hypothetical protein [Fictibacillus phosphorivorans]MCM3777103.1 hypothetical protein [Fictibacillus phosphorivorans]